MQVIYFIHTVSFSAGSVCSINTHLLITSFRFRLCFDKYLAHLKYSNFAHSCTNSSCHLENILQILRCLVCTKHQGIFLVRGNLLGMNMFLILISESQASNCLRWWVSFFVWLCLHCKWAAVGLRFDAGVLLRWNGVEKAQFCSVPSVSCSLQCVRVQRAAGSAQTRKKTGMP